MTEAEILLEARRRAAERAKYPGYKARILAGRVDNVAAVVRASREIRQELAVQKPSKIVTAEIFERCVGYPPEQDDLERSNCPLAGQIGHTYCGWDGEKRLPVFLATAVRLPNPSERVPRS